MVLLELAVFILVLGFVARWVAAGVGAGGNAALNPAHTAELVRLREEVDQLTAQVLRLQEEQSFTMRLLAEGEAAKAALPPAEDPTTHTEKP
ncbi:MAG TPA: hypothetical protein VJT67_07515 [Longimicrobiaceae bacterium]|nr:hypothetical protein [Longimicrobiaceae bacterium]